MNSKRYIESQAKAAKPITTDDMLCKLCVFTNDNLPPAHCNVYRPGESYKPTSAILNDSCPDFRRRNE